MIICFLFLFFTVLVRPALGPLRTIASSPVMALQMKSNRGGGGERRLEWEGMGGGGGGGATQSNSSVNAVGLSKRRWRNSVQ